MGTYTAENGDLYTLLRYINTDFISHLKEIKNNKSNLKEKKRIEYRKKGLKWNFNETHFSLSLFFLIREYLLIINKLIKIKYMSTI